MAALSPPVPTEIVLDANVMGAYVFSESSTALAQAVCGRIRRGEIIAYVPALFWAEVQQICHRKRLRSQSNPTPATLAQAEEAYQHAFLLPLVDAGTDLVDHRAEAWALIMALRIRSYDAYYLTLARNLRVPVWTFDGPFRNQVHEHAGFRDSVLLIGEDVIP